MGKEFSHALEGLTVSETNAIRETGFPIGGVAGGEDFKSRLAHIYLKVASK